MFDFPIFAMPLFGHRFIFAFDAIVHVFVSHAAVGGSIVLALAQYFAIKNNDRKFDELTYKILFTLFILATAVGALTGIGIWVHVNIINPAAIGALLRVFFWKWFVEWIVFNIEMILLLMFFLTWKSKPIGTPAKAGHFKLVVGYAVASWLTMAIITAILGFQMTPGNWLATEFPAKPDYLASLMNPSWLPSLGFRTFFAILWASAGAMVLTWFFTKADLETRQKGIRFFGKILYASVIPLLVFGYWYYLQFPQAAKDLFSIGAVTRRFAVDPQLAVQITLGLVALAVVSSAYLFFKPTKAPMLAAVALLVASGTLIGEFERVREFVRKPYIIYGYMYANGIRVQDMPLINKEGYLKQAVFLPEELRKITPENKVRVGEQLYLFECRYCHTVNGINSVKTRVKGWDEATIYHRIGQLNSPATPYMPPFAGTDEERAALAAYLVTLNADSKN
ncbi:MAG: c-type cytochrome [Azonexus sp.]